MSDRRTAREEAIDRYLAESTGARLVGKGKMPTPPRGLTERELIRAAARRLGITEQWYRQRYLKEFQEKAAQREAEIARLHQTLGDS